MPAYPDKIIINSKGGGGMQSLIDCDFEVLTILGDELIKLEMLKDTVDLRDTLKAACDEHYDAQMKYHEILRKLIAETAARIDKKVLAP